MDDIVKILIGVGFVAFSIYRKAQKKKKNAIAKSVVAKKTSQHLYNEEVNSNYNKVNTPSADEKSIFDILQKEMSNYNRTNEFVSEKQQTEDTYYDEKNNNEVNTEYIDNYSHSAIDRKEIDADFKAKTIVEKDEIEFDLKDAVIYSELLKPKYF